MRCRAIHALFAASGGVLLLGMWGCEDTHYSAGVGVSSPPPAYVEERDVYAPEPPPPPIVEEYGPAPGPDYLWIGGGWYWSDGHYHWRHGNWDRRPHRGAEWEESRWEHGGRGWERHEGHWR
jgi:hypothetical protein